jgi:exopolysaccharide production protein ExoQ
MPPIIALIITIIFILFLLRLDRKQYPDASLSLWLPTFWLLILVGKPLALWFGSSGTSLEEGSPLDRNFQILLLCLGLLITIGKNVKIIGTLRQNPSVILLLGFMLISITWSDMPFISFKRWIRNLVPIFMALIIVTENNPRQALQSIFRRLIYIHIPLSLLVIRYFPELGRVYGRWEGEVMWIGVCPQKNGLANLCMFALLYFVWAFIRRRKGLDKPVAWYQKYIEIFIICLSAYLFMGPNHTPTYSATALLVLIIAFTSLFGLLWLKKYNIIINANALTILIMAIIIYGTVTPFLGGLTLLDPSAALNRESTLTGRNHIWAFLVPQAMQKPILGHGYGGFWTEAMKNDSYNYPAHNGYLETLLDTGFVGLLFLSIFLIANCRKAQKLMTSDFEWGILWFSIILAAVARNTAESAVMSITEFWPAIMFFIMISFSSNISKQAESIKTEPFPAT